MEFIIKRHTICIKRIKVEVKRRVFFKMSKILKEKTTSIKTNSVNQSKNELKLEHVTYTAVRSDDDEYELIEPDGGL